MSKPVLFITGGNAGLGYETVKALLKFGTAYDIILGSRNEGKGEAAIASLEKEVPETGSTLTLVQADVESDASIENAYKTVEAKFGRLDILVNNAGGNFDAEHAQGKIGLREAFNKSWDVNVSGTHVLTHTFIPLLLKAQHSPARILFIASGTSSLTATTRFDHPALARINASPEAGWPKDLGINPITMYRSSKTGLNMLAREWARTLKNDGVKIFAVSPGFLATGLAGIGPEKLKEMGAKDPVEGANFVRDVVAGKRDDDAGLVIIDGGVQPW